MSDITVKELKTKKYVLRQDIAALITQFTEETGVQVDGLSVSYEQAVNYTTTIDRYVPSTVDIVKVWLDVKF